MASTTLMCPINIKKIIITKTFTSSCVFSAVIVRITSRALITISASTSKAKIQLKNIII